MSQFSSHTASLESPLSAAHETVQVLQRSLGTPASTPSVRIYTDKLSDAANATRPGLAACWATPRVGDTVVVTAIDVSADRSPK